MRSFIKNRCIMFCIIFSVLVLIHFFRGGELSNDVVYSFIFVSFFSSVMSFVLKDNEKFRARRVMIYQLIYLCIIMVTIVGISCLLGWKQSFSTVGINFIIVMGIYLLIKYLQFTEDKKEAEGINTALKERKNNMK